jgi:hypothetical protein
MGGGSSENDAALLQLGEGGCFGVGMGTVKGFVLGATFPVVVDRLPPPPSPAAAAPTPPPNRKWGRIAAYNNGRFRVEYSDGACVALDVKALSRAIASPAAAAAAAADDDASS